MLPSPGIHDGQVQLYDFPASNSLQLAAAWHFVTLALQLPRKPRAHVVPSPTNPGPHTHAPPMHSALGSHSLNVELLRPHASLAAGKKWGWPIPNTSPNKRIKNTSPPPAAAPQGLNLNDIPTHTIALTSAPEAIPAICPCDTWDLGVTHTPLLKSGTE